MSASQQIASRNVLVKSYGEKHHLMVSQAYLCDCVKAQGNEVSDDYLRKSRSVAGTDRKAAWAWTKVENTFYYFVDQIPNRAPKHYRDSLPTDTELLAMARKPFDKAGIEANAVRQMANMVADYSHHSDISYFMFESNPTYPFDKATKLAQGLSILKMLLFLEQDKAYVRVGLDSYNQFYQVAANWVASLEIPNLKTTSAASLRNKMDAFATLQGDQRKQRRFMVSKKFGNANAKVVGATHLVDTDTGEVLPWDLHETAMFVHWLNLGHANKHFKVVAYSEGYKPLVEGLGHTPIAYRTFCQHTEVWHNKAKGSLERHGSAYFGHKYLPYVPCEPLRYKDSLWAADGSGMKEQYRTPDGKVATLYGMMVFDVASGYMLALQVTAGTKGSERESMENVMMSFRKAWDSSGGYSPTDLLTDNGGGFSNGDTQGRLQVLLGHKARTTSLGNSQENPAEVLVKLFNATARYSDAWAGQYQAKTIEYKANPDYQDAATLPNINEAYERLQARMEQYNNQIGGDGLTRKERYERLERNPKCRKATEQEMRYAFGMRNIVDVSDDRGFVNCTKEGNAYQYTIPNLATNMEVIAKATGYTAYAKVLVCHDGEVADLYTDEGKESKFIISCEATKKAFKSASEATEENALAAIALRANKEEFKQAAEQFRDDLNDAYGQMSDLLEYGTLAAVNKGKAIKTEQNDRELVEVEKLHATPQPKYKPSPAKKVEDTAWDDFF